MRNIKLITFLIFLSFNSFSQKNYTFCRGELSITLIDGGKAEIIRFNSSGSIVKRFDGEWDLYGKGYGPTETLKIKFEGEEYRFELMRDGNMEPSKIFDIQMREFNLCKVTKARKEVENFEGDNSLNFFVGSYNIPDKKLKIVITNVKGNLNAVIYKNGKILSFNTSCGKSSKFVQAELYNQSHYTTIYLTPNNCNETKKLGGGWPNSITLRRYDAARIYPERKYYVLDITFSGMGLERVYAELKKANHN
jgi:hypothetical protein